MFLASSACSKPAGSGFLEATPSASTDAPCRLWGDAVGQGQVGGGLSEISGIAASRQNPELLWVHEDSNALPELTAVSTQGDILGTLTLLGVTNNDWEDLALAPCPEDSGRDCLFVGDIGDNGNSRTNAAILVTPEPEYRDGVGVWSAAPTVYPFHYPAGPSDAEALLVPPDGLPIIPVKRFDGVTTFHRFPQLSPGENVALTRLFDLTIGKASTGLAHSVTAADIWPTGERLLLRTYGALYEFKVDPNAFAQGDAAALSHRTTLPSALELQGESAAYDPIARRIWHVAEFSDPVLHALPCLDPSP